MCSSQGFMMQTSGQAQSCMIVGRPMGHLSVPTNRLSSSVWGCGLCILFHDDQQLSRPPDATGGFAQRRLSQSHPCAGRMRSCRTRTVDRWMLSHQQQSMSACLRYLYLCSEGPQTSVLSVSVLLHISSSGEGAVTGAVSLAVGFIEHSVHRAKVWEDLSNTRDKIET